MTQQIGLPQPISGMTKEAKQAFQEMRACVAKDDLLGALRFAEEARVFAPECRQVLLCLASLYESRGLQLGRVQDEAAAAPCFFQAADCIRTIQTVYQELSVVEIHYLRRAFYNEARAYTLRGDLDAALGSLRAALEAGHLNVEEISIDSTFEALRDHPSLRPLLDEFGLKLDF